MHGKTLDSDHLVALLPGFELDDGEAPGSMGQRLWTVFAIPQQKSKGSAPPLYGLACFACFSKS